MVKANKKTCIICGKEKPIKEFIKHRNAYMYETFGVCSACAKRITKETGTPVEALRMANIPYVEELWLDQKEKFEGADDEAFAAYLRAIGPKTQFSNFLSGNVSLSSELSSNSDFVITEEIGKRWGYDLDENVYRALESQYNDLLSIKKPTTNIEVSQYIALCWNKYNYQLMVRDYSTKSVEKSSLNKLIEESTKSLGLDISYEDENAIKGVGIRIRNWEQHAPIPQVSEDMQDVDGIQKYIEKWLLAPLRRNFNKASQKELDILANPDPFSHDVEDMESDDEQDTE